MAAELKDAIHANPGVVDKFASSSLLVIPPGNRLWHRVGEEVLLMPPFKRRGEGSEPLPHYAQAKARVGGTSQVGAIPSPGDLGDGDSDVTEPANTVRGTEEGCLKTASPSNIAQFHHRIERSNPEPADWLNGKD